jgi:hypothetical protein
MGETVTLGRFLLGIDNPEFRRVIEDILRTGARPVESLPSSESLLDADISDAMLVIDTGDDLLKLKRIVNGIYEKNWDGTCLPIHGIASEEALAADPDCLLLWLYRGLPPLLSVQLRRTATGYILLRDIELLK